jgi:hypothetical protein
MIRVGVMVRGPQPFAESTGGGPPMRALADICRDLEIEIVPTAVRRSPGQTCAAQTMQRILEEHGEGHLILTLRTILESGNNRLELVAPTLWAVSDIILAHPTWTETGLAFIEAFDAIDLSDLRSRAKANRRAVAPRKAIATMLFEHLRPVFESDQQGRMI